MPERTTNPPHHLWGPGPDGPNYHCKRCGTSKVEDYDTWECVTDEVKVAFIAMHAALVRYDDRKGWTPAWARGLRFKCARWINRWQGHQGGYFAERTYIPTAKQCISRGLGYGVPRYLKQAAKALNQTLPSPDPA